MEAALAAVRKFLPQYKWEAELKYENLTDEYSVGHRCNLFVRDGVHRTYCFWGATWEEIESKIAAQTGKQASSSAKRKENKEKEFEAKLLQMTEEKLAQMREEPVSKNN